MEKLTGEVIPIYTRYTEENYTWLKAKSFKTGKSMNLIVNEALEKERRKE
jgi:hypothetical protein